MKRYLICLLAAALLLTAGCSKGPETSQPDAAASVQQATTEPESLTDVLDAIYSDVDMKGLSDVDNQTLTALFHLEPSWVSKYAIRYSNGRYGVADVAIIKPQPEHSEDVVAALELRRSDRIAEFENYDVHDSLNIAKNAEIYSRGDYVILLMTADPEAVRTQIQELIPG